MKFNWDRKKSKLGWAMPLTWPYINSITHMSTFTLHRPNFLYLETSRGGDIAEKRELQCEEGMKQGCTEFILLDGDMVYPPTIINDLYGVLKQGADMAGGLCYRGYEPYNPLIWHPTKEKKLEPFVDYQFGDLVNAGATGAACLLIKRKVFEGVKKPWFRIQKETVKQQVRNGLKKRYITTVLRRGEDTYFTRKATKAGFKLKVMTSYDIGHMREFAVDRHFWITFMILNQMGSWENAIKLYKKLKDKEWFEREVVQPKIERR